MRKILITGAAGYVGSALARVIIQRGHDEVTLWDNYSVPSSIMQVCNVPIVHKDICDPDIDVSAADVVVNCAAISGIRDCEVDNHKARNTNVRGVFNLLRTCKGKFIFPSTSAVYGQAESPRITEAHPTKPRNYYGLSKLQAEEVVKLYHNYCILRFSNIYGKALTCKRTVADLFIENALKGEPLTIHGSGEQRRDFVHINDVLVAYWLAMKSDITDGTFNIGGNEALSVNDIAELVVKSYRMIFKNKVEVKHIPSDCGVLWKDFTYSSERAIEALKYEPTYSVGMEISGRLNANSRSMCDRKSRTGV